VEILSSIHCSTCFKYVSNLKTLKRCIDLIDKLAELYFLLKAILHLMSSEKHFSLIRSAKYITQEFKGISNRFVTIKMKKLAIKASIVRLLSIIDIFLGDSHIDAIMTCCTADKVPFEHVSKAKEAFTKFKFKKLIDGHSIIKCYPKTGRTH